MIAPPIPSNERERLSSLYEYGILDTLPEKEYDDITRIAAEICGMPISLITLIDSDRQWFKSKHGIDGMETKREHAFCAHAILEPHEIFVVNDSAKDIRFHDNPYVTGDPFVGFYAGVPLVNDTGAAMGTLCVLDSKPNQITAEQKETLRALARQVVSGFEVRRKHNQLIHQKMEMEQLIQDLTNFAHATAHDIKSPCSSINMCATYMRETYANLLDKEGKEMLSMMQDTSKAAIKMIDGILTHALQTAKDTEKTMFTFGQITQELRKLLNVTGDFTFDVKNTDLVLYAAHGMLQQVLLNLCANAIKYNDKSQGSITLSATENDKYYIFHVSDNGPGISKEDQSRIFDMFSTLGTKDRFNNSGTGIGLATVKRLVNKMGGTISIESELKKGTTFTFSAGR